MERTMISAKIRTDIKVMLQELAKQDLRSMSNMLELLISQEHAKRQCSTNISRVLVDKGECYEVEKEEVTG